ncbi:MAG: hypothetical protein ACYC3I_10415 [Gemmataceae bacterium]
MTLPAALLSVGLTGSEASAALSSLTVHSLAQAATAFVSGGAISGVHVPAISLTEEMTQIMSVKLVKALAVLVFTLSLASGAGFWASRMLIAESP